MSIAALISLAFLGTAARAAPPSPGPDTAGSPAAYVSASATASASASTTTRGACSSTASSQAEVRVGDTVIKKSAQKTAHGNGGSCGANASASIGTTDHR